MSLEALRQVRREGVKPDAPLKILVGKRAPNVDGYADVIAVTASDEPALMDWRAVIGLPFVLLICDGFNTLGERVLDALMAAGAQPIGAAWGDVETCTDEATKPVLRHLWELLCL